MIVAILALASLLLVPELAHAASVRITWEHATATEFNIYVSQPGPTGHSLQFIPYASSANDAPPTFSALVPILNPSVPAYLVVTALDHLGGESPPSGVGVVDPADFCSGDDCEPPLGSECAAVDYLPGDCNQSGFIDAGDATCTVHCLLGNTVPGADCACPADCNCTAGVDASDPTCAIRRLLGTFVPDTCDAESPATLSTSPDYRPIMPTLSVGRLRSGRRSGRRVAAIRARGEGVEQVASARLWLDPAGGRIKRVRLAARLRRSGYRLHTQLSGLGLTAFVANLATNIPAPPIGHGRVLIAVTTKSTQRLEIVRSELGSTSGLPVTSAAALARKEPEADSSINQSGLRPTRP